MRSLEIEIVRRTVQIGRHEREKIAAVLAIIIFTQLQAGDLGNGIGLVGLFQLTAQQVFLFQWLRRQFGIDARAAEKKQFFYFILVRRMDNIGGDQQVVIDKLGAISVVGQYAAHLGRGDDHHLRPLLVKKGFDVLLPAQVQFSERARDDPAAALSAEQPHKRRTDQACMARI